MCVANIIYMQLLGMLAYSAKIFLKYVERFLVELSRR